MFALLRKVNLGQLVLAIIVLGGLAFGSAEALRADGTQALEGFCEDCHLIDPEDPFTYCSSALCCGTPGSWCAFSNGHSICICA